SAASKTAASAAKAAWKPLTDTWSPSSSRTCRPSLVQGGLRHASGSRTVPDAWKGKKKTARSNPCRSHVRAAYRPAAPLDDAHRFDQTHHAPRLGTRDGTAFRDFDSVAFVVLVRLVVRLVLCGTHDDLAIAGVLDSALEQADHVPD